MSTCLKGREELKDCIGRLRTALISWICRPLMLAILIYGFICSLSFLSSSFRLLGGKKIGEVFSSSVLLQNPVAGLMIGILATAAVQSSSMSTSIVITMVAANALPVEVAIPIVMGANIGTSITNTLVSMGESGDREMFSLAFSGATIHDMYNWLVVLVLLPLECATGYLFHLTSALVRSIPVETNKSAKQDFLKLIVKPFTEKIIKLDKKVIEKIALGHTEYVNASLIKRCTESESIPSLAFNQSNILNISINGSTSVTNGKSCSWFLFQSVPLSDTVIGLILLLASILLLCGCLITMVKLLKAMLKGKVIAVIKKVVNADFCGAGYIAIFAGFLLTVLIQSSSILLSVLTPLVGMGVIRLEAMYPITLGANIGGTGIILFYPIPATRLPIKMAKAMGNTTARYRWFPVCYLLVMFMLVPLLVFGISLAGIVPLSVFLGIGFLFLAMVIVVNVLQTKCPSRLPVVLQTWEFLPKCLHSLQPLDNILTNVRKVFSKCCLGDGKKLKKLEQLENVHMKSMNNDGAEKGLLDKPSHEGDIYPQGLQSLKNS